MILLFVYILFIYLFDFTHRKEDGYPRQWHQCSQQAEQHSPVGDIAGEQDGQDSAQYGRGATQSCQRADILTTMQVARNGLQIGHKELESTQHECHPHNSQDSRRRHDGQDDGRNDDGSTHQDGILASVVDGMTAADKPARIPSTHDASQRSTYIRNTSLILRWKTSAR